MVEIESLETEIEAMLKCSDEETVRKVIHGIYWQMEQFQKTPAYGQLQQENRSQECNIWITLSDWNPINAACAYERFRTNLTKYGIEHGMSSFRNIIGQNNIHS